MERLPDLSEPEPDQQFTDPLRELRALHSQKAAQLKLRCPRVFISHRRCDAAKALWVAWLANSERFDYWLDILDPNLAAVSLNLKLSLYQQAVLMAGIIELALLNCSHVIAVMTNRVPGTLWMPYEYGRVKDSQLISLEAAAWFDRSWGLTNTPEYFHLGHQLRNESEIRRWLGSQLKQFAQSQQPPRTAIAQCPTKPWQRAVPKAPSQA